MTTIDSSPLATSEWATQLQSAAEAFASVKEHPSPTDLTKALIQAEKAAKKQHYTYPYSALWGDWRLCFFAPQQAHQKGEQYVGKGRYFPSFMPAQISFYPASDGAGDGTIGSIGNQIQAGPLLIRLTGPARYLNKKNLLAFDFTHLQVSLFGYSLYNGKVRGGPRQQQQFADQPIAKLPFFAFFQVTDRYIAARGRGGGLAIWVKHGSKTP